ncbi:MAG: hypothetical protein U9R36_03285 [Elusimicrobiota bacterium]|nr:hypothetical protein [Elusimicrobiota bacterium]
MNKYLRNLIKYSLAGIVLLAGTAAPARSEVTATVDVSVSVRPSHNVPPDAVTDLAAVKGNYVSGGKEGKIDLSWTAPQTELDVLVSDYYIRWSTLSVNDAPFSGNTTAWWEGADGTDQIGTLESSPGLPVSFTVENEGLIPQSTYYFAVKAADEFGNISSFDEKTESLSQTFARASWDNIYPAAVGDLSGTAEHGAREITLSWTSPGDDGNTGQASQYYIKYATYSVDDLEGDTAAWWYGADDASDKSPLPAPPKTAGSGETYTITGLDHNFQYYFALKSSDERNNISLIDTKSASSSQEGIYPKSENVKPVAITDLSAAAVPGNAEAELSWTAPYDGYGNAADSYLIRYATYSVAGLAGGTTAWWNAAHSCINSLAPSAPGSSESIIVDGLSGRPTFYFAIKSVNKYANISDIDTRAATGAQASAFIEGYLIEPMAPAGIKIDNISSTGDVTLRWSRTILNTDLTKYSQHGFYRVYRTYGPAGAWTLVYSTTAYRDSYTWTDSSVSSGYTAFYRVRAVNKFGNPSGPSMAADTSSEREISASSADGTAGIHIPASISDILYKESNAYGDDIIVEIDNVETSDEDVLGRYLYRAISARTGKEAESFIFSSPRARIDFRYSTSDGNIVTGASSISPKEDDRQLAIYWHNGIEWIKLGGKVDTLNNTVSISAGAIGNYAVKLAWRPDSFEIIGIQPDKIFTPKSEYTNFIEFKYDNPREARVSGKIYDLRGAFVSSMESGNTATIGDSSGSLLWRGKYSSGDYAPAGVYIYQIEVTGAEEEVLNGTVIIAR